MCRPGEGLCDAQTDWLLLVDEVQTGVGRTGSHVRLPAVRHFCRTSASFAKGIAGGLPMSGIMANEKCRDVLTPGTHATTFGAQSRLRRRRHLPVQEIADGRGAG